MVHWFTMLEIKNPSVEPSSSDYYPYFRAEFYLAVIEFVAFLLRSYLLLHYFFVDLIMVMFNLLSWHFRLMFV